MHLSGRDVVLYITMAIYVGSLFLPGLVSTDEVSQTTYGYQILLIGSLGIFTGLLPVYGYALGILGFFALRAREHMAALACSALGFLFGLQAIYLQSVNAQINFFDSYNSWERGMGVLSVGYYVWLAALGFLVVQCVIAYAVRNSGQKV